jgi:malate permease and related proteins
MENLEVMVVLFIIVVLGYVACKLGYMGDKFDKKLSSIVVDITCPLLVLSSVMGDELPDRTLILPLLGVGFLTYILLLVFGFGVPRLISKNHDDQGMIGFALMFANVGFIGYPIVSSIFGPKAIFYAALLNMPNTFFIFTAGVMLIKGEYSVKQFNPKVLLSPALIAAAVAALLVALGVHTPDVIARPVTMVGNVTVPAALMIIGSSMAKLPLKEIIGSPKVYVASLLRLVVVPLSLYFFFKVCGVSDVVKPDRTLILPLLGVGFLTYILLLVFGFGVPRLISKNHDDQGMIGFALMFANVGFIGYPIVSSIFGPKAIFYAALLNMPNTFFIFTAGVMLIKGEYSVKQFNPKVLLSPALIAAAVAALLVALGVHTPDVIARPVTMVGNVTVPAALMIIGSSMAKLPLKEIIGSPKVYVASLLRLVVVPLSLYFFFKVCGVSDVVNNINTVVIAMPVASFGTMFCLKYGRNPALITELTFITTLGSILTIPLITLLFG